MNVDGFFDPLLEMFARMQEQHFMRDGRIPAIVAATPAEAIGVIDTYRRRS